MVLFLASLPYHARVFSYHRRALFSKAAVSLDTAKQNDCIPLKPLRKIFDETMHNCTAPVFQDFDTYLKTLPRKYNKDEGWKTLYEHPYWVNETELKPLDTWKRMRDIILPTVVIFAT